MTNLPIVLVALLCWGLVGVRPAAAQQAILDNTRLRLTLVPHADAPARHVLGWFESLDGSSITLRDHRGRMSTTQRTTVTRIEQSHGRYSRWRRTGFGFLVGVASGALFGLAAGDDCSTKRGTFAPCFDVALTAGVLGAWFGGIGAAVGASLPPGERWEPVSLPATSVP